MEDLPKIGDFVELLENKLPFTKIFPVSRGKAEEYFTRFLQGGDGTVLLAMYEVEGLGDIIIGCLALQQNELWWSEKPFLTNVVFYVHDKYRHLGIQMSMIQLAKKVADLSGIPLLAEIVDPEHPELYARFLKFNKFKTFGYEVLYVPSEET